MARATIVTLQSETNNALDAIFAEKVVNAQSMRIGLDRGEPLLLILDGLLRYAKAHRQRCEAPLCEDYVLGPYFLATLTNARKLLCGDGAVAMELDRSTDSKDNGTLETIFWAAMEAAGYTEADLTEG